MNNFSLNINLSGITAILFVIVAFVVALVVVVMVVMMILRNIKESVLKKKALNLVFFEVKLPLTNEVEIKAAEQMYTGLIGIGEKLKGLKKFTEANSFVSFEIVAFREIIKFYVVCPKKVSSIVDRQINGTYPMAEILKVKEYNIFPEEGHVAYTALKLDKESKVPIQSYE